MIEVILAVLLGIVIGRAYGWMKYHYPEFQAEIRLKVARKNAEIARYEEAEMESKLRKNDLFERITE